MLEHAQNIGSKAGTHLLRSWNINVSCSWYSVSINVSDSGTLFSNGNGGHWHQRLLSWRMFLWQLYWKCRNQCMTVGSISCLHIRHLSILLHSKSMSNSARRLFGLVQYSQMPKGIQSCIKSLDNLPLQIIYSAFDYRVVDGYLYSLLVGTLVGWCCGVEVHWM